MFKKCLYFSLGVLFLQNACFADRDALKGVNQQYMALMLGSEGILPQKATTKQINQMIDACITAGITDRLYGLGDKSAMFQAQIAKFEGYKKLDVQLAYAFYMLGYTKAPYEELKQSLGVSLDPNFDHEFDTICFQVFPGGTIFEYRDRLEDVIIRASKPLRFDDFVEVVPRAASPAPSGILSPVTTRSRSSIVTLRVKSDVRDSDAYKDLLSLGRTHEQIMRMLGQVVNEHTEPEEDIPSASLASLAFSSDETERYYTDAEIQTLLPPIAAAYKKQKAEGKSAQETREKAGKIMNQTIQPKYEGK